MESIAIRETVSGDAEQVLALYPQAFPEEELRPVVSALLGLGPEVLSLAGFDGAQVVGHVLFTLCGAQGQGRTGALLAPLGVLPSYQRRGLGTSLVRAGLDRLAARGVAQVFVLGDPAYYGRFGFAPERGVMAPYPLPEDWAGAWQSLRLAGRAPLAAGRLIVPAPWMEPALWGP